MLKEEEEEEVTEARSPDMLLPENVCRHLLNAAYQGKQNCVILQKA